MLEWLLILLPCSAILGWWLGKRSSQTAIPKISPVARDYLQGINYVLNEESDKAVALFIKMSTVDADTVEAHLALGNLFRRRGEVSRAILIHQNVIARPQLAKSHRIEALLALGRDYMEAGLFDRAEKLMLEVVESGEYVADSLRHLLAIYQQERDWEQAIIIAQRLESVTDQPMHTEVAHYYCELFLVALGTSSRYEQAIRFLKRALALDKACVRASLLISQCYIESGKYRQAFRILQRVHQQDPDFLSEAIPGLLKCAQHLHQEADLLVFLQKSLAQHPQIAVALLMTEYLSQTQGVAVACEFAATQLKQSASLRGLHQYLSLKVMLAQNQEQQTLTLVNGAVEYMLINQPLYQCSQCGYSGKVLHWQCPSCKLWATTKPIYSRQGR